MQGRGLASGEDEVVTQPYAVIVAFLVWLFDIWVWGSLVHIPVGRRRRPARLAIYLVHPAYGIEYMCP